MYFDKRIIYVLLGVMLIFSLSSFDLTSTLLSLPGVLIAITFHEFAHGYAAYKLGDNTAKEQGRLSLNPLNHIEPVGIFLLIFAGFGWGKPVQIDSNNFDRKYSLAASEAIVAAAGPIMNFVVAIISSIIYGILLRYMGYTNIISMIVLYTITTNVGLGVFNLIPLPPLDGSKILMYFVNYETKRWLQDNEQLFYILFLILWMTRLANVIIVPIISFITNLILKIAFIIA